ncbi:MAG: CRISPR-associated RAMP protein Csx7 [Syntrophobacteraceae bacterium]|jgi:CRISPR-associated RAMP protein (TIGR02581 family)
MHKRLFNQARITVDVTPITPLLIKSGMENADPALPDMSFVRTHNPQHGEVVYIPGSSLKGVLRSYTEKILRSLDIPCCDPLMTNKQWDGKFVGSCGRKNDKEPENTESGAGSILYSLYSCYACKMYGSTKIASRVLFTDGHAQAEYKTEKRTGVAIDRVTASALKGGLFDYEVVTSGTFRCDIFLSNFQLWQFGLVGVALRDLDEGYVQLGFAKSRGLGRVSAKVLSIEITYTKKPAVEGQLWGVGMDDSLRREYRFLENDFVDIDMSPETHGLRTKYSWKDDSPFASIVSEKSPCWKVFLNQGVSS